MSRYLFPPLTATNQPEPEVMNTKSSNRPQSLVAAGLTGIAALFVGGCATMTKAPDTVPAATVRITQASAAYYGSATTGKGALYFRGSRHNFTITSVGLGGTGGQTIASTGKVYGLQNLAEFPGAYRGVSSGLTLIEGKRHAKLTNANGVVIYLAGATEGLATSGGVQSYQITLTD